MHSYQLRYQDKLAAKLILASPDPGLLICDKLHHCCIKKSAMGSSSRPRTPSGGHGTVPQDTIPALPEGNKLSKQQENQARRSSFGLLLRRTKSGDFGSKGSKKERAHARELELQRQQREAANRPAPSLPALYNGAAPPKLETFGGEDSTRPANGNGRKMEPSMRSGNVPAPPPIPGNGAKGEFVDPYARSESMTHRGRYSYASSAVSSINSPRRVRRRKDPTPFNILIIGARNSGKTSFLNFLKSSLTMSSKKRSGSRHNDAQDNKRSNLAVPSGNFIPHYIETEIDGERIGLTIWDSEGLETNIVDLQLREMSSFLESKFEETFTEEMKVVRAPGVQDTHIHCAFLIIDPARLDKNIAQAGFNAGLPISKQQAGPRLIGGLDEDLDLSVLKTLQGKTTVVPVISKADTITTAHMRHLKRTVWDSLRKANLDPLEALGLDDETDSRDNRIDEGDEDEEDDDSDTLPADQTVLSQEEDAPSPLKRSSTGSIRQHKRQMSSDNVTDEIPYLPLSIISPDIYEPSVIGRKFPWGFADPYNAEHCDFVRLKDAVFSEWRGELREASRELWYEGWRTSRLKHRAGTPGR